MLCSIFSCILCSIFLRSILLCSILLSNIFLCIILLFSIWLCVVVSYLVVWHLFVNQSKYFQICTTIIQHTRQIKIVTQSHEILSNGLSNKGLSMIFNQSFSRSILFCSILLCIILLCSILLCSILFCSKVV